jgi:20S proteasome alpha/beta subunit
VLPPIGALPSAGKKSTVAPSEKPMTVCIAATCDSGKHIVVAADKMVTAGHPMNLEFEPPLSKIEVLSNSCVGLASGSLPFADQIFSEAKGKVGIAKPPLINEICGLLKDAYTRFRSERMDEQIVAATLGADFQSFKERGGTLPNYLQPQAGMYQNFVIQCQQFNLGLELLIAGIDATGAHIAIVANPGAIYFFDKLGYAAIGSGGQHALTSLHLGGHTANLSLDNTLFSVYTAKRASEVAPGVGHETNMAVISPTEVWQCTPTLIDKIKEAHDQHFLKTKPKLDVIQKAYEEERKPGC